MSCDSIRLCLQARLSCDQRAVASGAAKAAKQTLYVGERSGRTELSTIPRTDWKKRNNLSSRRLMTFHTGGKKSHCKAQLLEVSSIHISVFSHIKVTKTE